ncbi:hypothetical protein Tco_0515635, partial [Tanacetum coccineum]
MTSFSAAAAAANSSLESGGNAKTSPTKPIVGQKKPLEVLDPDNILYFIQSITKSELEMR